jgi:hypothetical protein
MQTVGTQAVRAATANNGNQLKLGRLSTLMV